MFFFCNLVSTLNDKFLILFQIVIKGKIKLHLVAESSDDISDTLYDQIKSTMKKLVRTYDISPSATRVTLSALGSRLVTKIPPTPQNLDSIGAEIDRLPKVGGAMILPLDETLDRDNTLLQHLVFITSKNLSISETKGYEAIKEAMREKRIIFNLVNVLSPQNLKTGEEGKPPQYQKTGEEGEEQDKQNKLDFLIEAVGGKNLPGAISLIGENTIEGLGKLISLDL